MVDDDLTVSKMNLTDVFLMSKRSLMERLFSASVHMIYSAASLEDVKVGRLF
jgi:hypothetical protein